MNCRRHGSKPTIALWMLIALADLAILAAAAGTLVTILVLTALATMGCCVVAARVLHRRTPATTKAVVRRRA